MDSEQANEEFEDERKTSDLMLALGEDVRRCQKHIARLGDPEANYTKEEDKELDFYMMQFIRAVFVFIESVTFSLKVSAVDYCDNHEIDVHIAERHFAGDIDHVIDENGRLREKSAHISLATNVRFAFNLWQRALGDAIQLDPAKEPWWALMKSSIKVRDRLTHPKMPSDLDVSGQEMVAAHGAYEGFKRHCIMVIVTLRGEDLSAIEEKYTDIDDMP